MPEPIRPPPPEPPAPSHRERRAVAWSLALTAVVTWESVSAVPSVGPPWLSFDKLAHFGVFGLLATTVARLEPARRWPLLGPLWAIVLVSAYGVAIEFLQSLTPMRSMEYADWVADTLGAAVAVVLYLRWTWYRRLLERPTGRPPGSRHQTGSNNAAALSGESGSTLRGAGHCEERGDDLSAEALAKAEAIQAKPDPSELDRHHPSPGLRTTGGPPERVSR